MVVVAIVAVMVCGRHRRTPENSCQILRLICIKFDFGWVSAPDPAEGAHSAPPDPLAGFKGSTSKGRGEERERGRGK